MEMYFSRLRLRRAPSVDALKQLIDPCETSRRVDAHHRLLWTLFADHAERKRDFIWRTENSGLFYVLSHRVPVAHDLFEAPETKVFAPVLTSGDRLRFVLRANAVRSVPSTDSASRTRGKKVDVAMHLLKDIPSKFRDGISEGKSRANERHEVALKSSLAWLTRQGEQHGFSIDQERFILDDYSTVTLPGYRGRREREPRFGIFDMKGSLTVNNPELFCKQLGVGFGRAKAFGQGLMLIRRE